jgi:hypothetical protein
MASAEADEFLAALEAGDEWEETGGDGKPVACAWMLRPKAIIQFISPYVPHRVTHADSRHPDAAEVWRKWQAYLGEAMARKQEKLSMPKASAS